jgi:hypothetical protein
MPVFQSYRYVIKNEDGGQIGEYTTSDFPPFKGNVIKLKSIPGYDYAEVVGVVWMADAEGHTVILKVKPSNKARFP